MPFRFQKQWRHPGLTGEHVSPEKFLRGVEETISHDGFWQATAEFYIGGRAIVTVRPKSAAGASSFLAAATLGGLVSTGEYDSLEHALRALALMSYGLVDVLDEGAGKGLIGG